ncbi:vWA domain-containing protein [Granulicella tundricola]|uniref:VWFA-related domain-containing protein n=1 Tax=Granulicella tundricola (strain ATCC BAA-1859 / DSM 23138 / MP5ACTX9) TaxID=1198114 RepID=E8WVD0_GRATM|nr:hypothetical protein [Granulicella tundricola]ADW68378.1 hypothetical protein AciX9_1316 [Granulicella tundricola MP5ACTX9]
MRMKLLSALTFATLLPLAVAQAQQEGLVPTQTLIRVDSKNPAIPTLDTTKLEVNNRQVQLTSIQPIPPTGVQIALLIDDGLRRSAAVQLEDVKKFIETLPTGTEILVGYMSNGGVRVASQFTTNHEDAVNAIRIPFGIPGISASPYFCLSEFVKHWPGNDSSSDSGPRSGTSARFAIMITNGVDPYNGSTSVLNQDSPYVETAIADAQRAGVAVSSIYYGDAGIRGGRASFSGQSYLNQLSQATGGEAYYQGMGNPVSLLPFFKEFQKDISETFIATFQADAGAMGRTQLVRINVKSSIPKLKLRHADVVRPGNHEAPQA